MRLPDLKKRKWNYTALAFATPATMLLVLMFVTSVAPFGDYTLLYSDMYHQYFPFFKEFREALRSGDSLLWNWSAGGGMDYLGLIAYYLGSPLNLLSVFVPEAYVLDYFTLLTPIKLSLASGFFAIMLKKLYGRDDLSLVVFGGCYGLCAWGLGYQWNIMWVDSFAMLPLVALGTVWLLRDRKYILYTVSLALAILANYYVGFFVCIFVLLLFFCYEICRFKSVWRSIKDFACIGVFTVLSIGMTCFLELPALAALQDTYSSINQFPEGFQVNMVSGETVTNAYEAWAAFKEAKEAGAGSFGLWWDALIASFPPVLEGMKTVAGQMAGGLTPTYIDGLPNIYCGVFAVALGFLFLLSGQVKLRDKICAVALLLLFMCSFIIRQLDYIWHGFHFTNQIPYRFSFLFCFVLLYMAYRAWLVREEWKLWQIAGAGILSGLLLMINKEMRSDTAFVIFNLAFLGLYFILMLYGHRLVPQPVTVEAEAPALPPEEEMEQPAADEPQSDAELMARVDRLLEDMGQPVEPETESFPEEREEPADIRPRDNWWKDLVDRLPPHAQRSRYAALGIAAVMLLELVVNVISFATSFSIYDYDYPKKEEAAASMFQVMKDLENDENQFYRAEVTHAQTLNDGPLNGYDGLSTFTSSANVRMTEFMEALGYGGRNSWNRYCWEESSPVANLFLNLKYMIHRDGTPGSNAYFDVLHSYEGLTLMENNAYLPLGFLANADLEDMDFNMGGNTFAVQNALFSSATGLTEAVWMDVAKKDVEVTATDGINITANNIGGYTGFTSGANPGKITYTYNITQTGFMCLDLTLYAQKNFSVWHNGIKLYSENYTLPFTMAVCDVAPGDTVELVIECAANTSSAVVIYGAVLDEAVFRAGYDVLAASTLELTQFSTTRIRGVIDCDRDGLLYTSIPQCGNARTEEGEDENGELIPATTSPVGNWVAYVDGVAVDVVLVGDCMVAVPLTEGVHEVEFRYENRAFRYGALISIGCAVIFGGIITTDCLLRRRKKRLEQ
ncbi:MAG: hypothetical protein E7438_00140 [Ruminococcaceae bacterium]|nr:hypothetical protein [Oscillospiraceae bacterium]